MTDFFSIISKKKGAELKAFKKRILKVTGAANPTWYSWLQNKKVSPPNQKLIAIELNEKTEILFPD